VALYDDIGIDYSTSRRTDPRWMAAIPKPKRRFATK